jgi:hypothetical protein
VHKLDALELSRAMSALQAYDERIGALLAVNDPETLARSPFSKGLGRLFKVVHAHGADAVVPATLAAFLLRQNLIFNYSHDFAFVAPEQARAFLEKRPIKGWIDPQGRLVAQCLDYAYRPSVEAVEEMCLYFFAENYDIAPMAKSKKSTGEANAVAARRRARAMTQTDAGEVRINTILNMYNSAQSKRLSVYPV